ncbi:MAG: gfo/Idh/MocA family oxidoreductase, partial [Cyanobacteria bacterium J06623_7]
NGVSADLTYGKGDVFWQGKRTLEIWGEQGKIIFEGQKGTLIQGDRQIEIPVTPRKGLFAQDTEMVLDYLYYQQPLYIQPQASLYALKVANAAQQAALSQSIVYLD